MQPQSRREFLVKSAAMSAAAFGLPSALHAAIFEPPEPTQMTIARWAGDSEAARQSTKLAQQLTEKAIAGLGGMKRFVSAGDTVWIKPNIGWNRGVELAANTHPDVVATLVRLCKEAGAKRIKVGDYPCNDARQSYENSGIGPAAEQQGAEIIYLDKRRFRDMNIGGNLLKSHPVYPEIIECDVVINVPVCKHHGSTRVSLCMKNYMGVVEKRNTFHQNLPTAIADITQFMKPKLCVLDATRMLTDHGPTGGDVADVKWLHTIAAGTDIVALDAFGAELLGNQPADIGTIQAGVEYKLGTMDYGALRLEEFQLS